MVRCGGVCELRIEKKPKQKRENGSIFVLDTRLELGVREQLAVFVNSKCERTYSDAMKGARPVIMRRRGCIKPEDAVRERGAVASRGLVLSSA